MRNVHERVKLEPLFVLPDPCLCVRAVKSKQCYYGLHEEASTYWKWSGSPQRAGGGRGRTPTTPPRCQLVGLCSFLIYREM